MSRRNGNTGRGIRPLDMASLTAARVEGTCPTRKMRFPSEQEAAKALKAARAGRSGTGRIEKRVYLCPRCVGGWHLTSRSAWGDEATISP